MYINNKQARTTLTRKIDLDGFKNFYHNNTLFSPVINHNDYNKPFLSFRKDFDQYNPLVERPDIDSSSSSSYISTPFPEEQSYGSTNSVRSVAPPNTSLVDSKEIRFDSLGKASS